MTETKYLPVESLNLDLGNFRTLSQPDELHAVQALISIKPDYFWALMESLIDSGYLPTENILVLKTDSSEPSAVVREGNRRIAALKLIHGYVATDSFGLPANLQQRIDRISDDWRNQNQQVPCTIYSVAEGSIVDKIITLAHDKGEKAGRYPWNPVAKARHSRDVNHNSEPALDLLEKYLKENNRSIASAQAERWAGDFPLSVLAEAMKRLAPRLGAHNAPTLARAYPSIQYRDPFDSIVRDIGLEVLGFPTVRDTANDFAIQYGIPPESSPRRARGAGAKGKVVGPSALDPDANTDQDRPSDARQVDPNDMAQPGEETPDSTNPTPPDPGVTAPPVGPSPTSSQGKGRAVPIQDPRSVRNLLKGLKPQGTGRDKVVTLRNEALKLDLVETPLAFCFILRSIFEISAKAYCDDHSGAGGPTYQKPDGTDRQLLQVLNDVKQHLTNSGKDKAVERKLHGAMVELGKTDGILSITSLNQLVHNPRFSTSASDICTVFGNIFPLLEAMN